MNFWEKLEAIPSVDGPLARQLKHRFEEKQSLGEVCAAGVVFRLTGHIHDDVTSTLQGLGSIDVLGLVGELLTLMSKVATDALLCAEVEDWEENLVEVLVRREDLEGVMELLEEVVDDEVFTSRDVAEIQSVLDPVDTMGMMWQGATLDLLSDAPKADDRLLRAFEHLYEKHGWDPKDPHLHLVPWWLRPMYWPDEES